MPRAARYRPRFPPGSSNAAYPAAPPGWHWGKRTVPIDWRQPFSMGPYIGRDANDTAWIDDIQAKKNPAWR